MIGISDDDPPDAELQQLVSRFIDQTLTEAERDRLEQRLRDETAAKDYCANAIRFEATLQEALNPQSLEWEETRRVVFDMKKGSPAWSVQRQQTIRYGDSDRSLMNRVTGARKRWWIGGIGVLIVASIAAVFFYQSHANTYSLRNGDFEAMDLSQSPRGVDQSVLYWQDYFSNAGTELCEVGRVTKGQFFAKSGRNAVKLRDRAFLNQLILNKAGGRLKAVPGLKVVVSGWSYNEGSPSYALRASLRFVASGYPDMIQYEAANVTMPLKEGGWHPFKTDLVIPEDLLRPPSDLSKNAGAPPPSIQLDGKELTLSLDNRSPGGVMYLDDLAIEIVNPEKK
ncbi:MAG: hypothetical protein ABIS50_19850 [Luteolibacter sp.]|uniref:hypothetical protein n=1 Tax=Luteolibacter sp. TaxID=1962973 RepID=UPI003263997D